MREAHYGCRIDPYGTYKGMRTLVLQNELIRMSILLDKGSDIFELLYKPKDVDFMWRSPIGLRHPPIPASMQNPQGIFTDYYHGGWQELFPSASGPSYYQGAHLGFHGEVATCPWEFAVLVDEPEAVEVLLTTKTLRTPFILEKRIRLEAGRPVIQFRETIHNYGRTELDFMWGHHPSYGAPFLSEDCILELPDCTIITSDKGEPSNRLPHGNRFDWPYAVDVHGKPADLRKIGGIGAETTDMFYATAYKEGWYALTNRRMNLGIGMAWPVDDFPHLWIWQEFGGTKGYPWYGNAYTVVIEPFTSRPSIGEDGLNEAIRNGTAKKIRAGDKISKELKVVIYETDRGVEKILPTGEVIER
ncbi:DUF4432 domain-containing protein [Paenibacillus naphthalenovorans]|uniref:DUF4432 family protein n=1 Tax=Paenibacillus naphthalenovorans TaxID=162209 RepID=UPI0010B570AC|nr:DUF4432 family protein [Paenibacillus naphthalenovorans]GCL71928.1 DUF4432 domain-containing protein [Paenibacillus naphthalenovorans]